AKPYSDQCRIYRQEGHSPAFHRLDRAEPSGALGGESACRTGLLNPDGSLPEYVLGQPAGVRATFLQSFLRNRYRSQQPALRLDSVLSATASQPTIHKCFVGTAADRKFHLPRTAVHRREKVLQRFAVTGNVRLVQVYRRRLLGRCKCVVGAT